MSKEFGLKNNNFAFIKSYIAYLWPYVIVFVAIVLQLLQINFKYKYEGIILLLSAALVLIIVTGFYLFNKFKDIRYIVSQDSILVFDHNRGEVFDYSFSELKNVKFPRVKDIKKLGKQYFYLKFKNKKKLVFTSVLPYFTEIRDYLMSILKEKGYL